LLNARVYRAYTYLKVHKSEAENILNGMFQDRRDNDDGHSSEEHSRFGEHGSNAHILNTSI
jgi:hypothetical protein